jgi:hypothetical protein
MSRSEHLNRRIATGFHATSAVFAKSQWTERVQSP